jgi:Flp pilus assembly protein TadD
MRTQLLVAALMLFTFGVSAQDFESRIKAADELGGSGKTEEAYAILNAIIAEDKADPAKYAADAAIQYQLARAFLRLNDYESAAARAARVIELDPTRADAHGLRGSALQALGKNDEAIKAFQSSIELAPKDARALEELGRLFLELGRTPEALELLRRADVERPDRPDTLILIAAAIAEIEGNDAAGPIYDRVVELDPTNPLAAYNSGMIAFLAKDFAKARRLLEVCHQSAPEDAMVLAKLVQTCEATSDATARDKYRDQIYALFRANEPTLVERKFFIRDQFAVGEKWIFASEFFDYTKVGVMHIKYRFTIADGPTGNSTGNIAFGRGELDTEFARSTGHLGPDEHMYAIDGNYDWGHATYYLGPEEFDYATVKARVIDILTDEKKPISSTTINN